MLRRGYRGQRRTGNFLSEWLLANVDAAALSPTGRMKFSKVSRYPNTRLRRLFDTSESEAPTTCELPCGESMDLQRVRESSLSFNFNIHLAWFVNVTYSFVCAVTCRRNGFPVDWCFAGRLLPLYFFQYYGFHTSLFQIRNCQNSEKGRPVDQKTQNRG